MATKLQPPHVDSKNKKVDYSKWERRNKKKSAQQKNIETILWTTVPDPNAASNGDHQSTGAEQCLPLSSTTARRLPNDKSGKSHPKTADGNTLTSTPYGSGKKSIAEQKTDPAFIKKKDNNTKTLKLLLNSKGKAVKELEALCALVQERNQLLAQEIRDTDKGSVQSAEEYLDRHEKLGTSISAFNDWSQSQITEANDELKETEEVSKKSLSALQRELSEIHAKLANAQAELHTLKTYKDKEYPVKVLIITNIKREIEKLEETQQDEYEDLKQLCQNETETQAERNLQRRQKLLVATVKENVSRVPHVIRLMASDNVTMKAEIEFFKKEIEKQEEKNDELTHSIQELRLSRKSVREEIFEDVFTKLDKCTPDMDVVLNIPKEEWLPI
ncbi:uncharacterized protein C20orf96 homolog isoform X2 [Clupea harengus]|uniref:Uncharacterized protein C20orf96 homolog isoform X2 n=1 Tax=Clupea harengus TaxID=7950 RepID=A0A6P8FI75_CLUHA|nr:uncharacterized protein C20orf96 homolog isoform X2 [Clupea harengus]